MNVLFATDGSPYAMDAARFMVDLRFNEPLDVVLLTVVPNPPTAGPESIQPWFPEWLEQEEQRIKEDQASLETLFSDRCNSITKLRRDGHPAAQILDAAKDNNVDLIVIGARGHSLLGRVLLGSVSDAVATHAKCSVLVVRPGEEGSGERTPRKITFAYDSSFASREAVSEMLDLDWDTETEVDLFTVIPAYGYMLGDGITGAALANEQKIFEAMVDEGKSMSQQMGSKLPRTEARVVEKQHVGDAIVAAARENKSDLIFIGDAGHSLLHDWILGSTTKYVLRHAPCSVWISRHHRQPSNVRESIAEESSAT